MSPCIFCKNEDHKHEDRPDTGGLSVRVTNALWNKFGPCVKWEQVATLSRHDYKKIKNLGRESINQLERALHARGLCFAGVHADERRRTHLVAVVAFRSGAIDWGTCLAAMDAYVAFIKTQTAESAPRGLQQPSAE